MEAFLDAVRFKKSCHLLTKECALGTSKLQGCFHRSSVVR